MTSIVNNIAANTDVLYVNRNIKRQNDYLAQLSSGQRTVNAATDPGALATATILNSDAKVLSVGATNAANIQAVFNTADGSLSQIADILTQLKSLATEALSGTQTSSALTNLNTEFTKLVEQIANISDSTKFNGTALIDGSFGSSGSEIKVQVGVTSTDVLKIDLSSVDVTSGNFVSGTLVGVDTTDNAKTSLDNLTNALNDVAGFRALVGSYTAQAGYSENVASTSQTNISAAASNYTDADTSQVETEYNNASTLTQAGIAALTKAQTIPQALLRLLQA